MKLAAFKDLCDREWAKPQRGDVQALHLTDESLLELNCEVILASGSEPWLMPMVLHIGEDDLPAIRDGRGMLPILNPVTRSTVTVSGGSDRDMAQVYSLPGGAAEVPVETDEQQRRRLLRETLETVRSLGAAQRKTADDLRDAITKAREAGVTWQAIGTALGEPYYQTVYRQYNCGSPIVVVRAWQNPRQP